MNLAKKALSTCAAALLVLSGCQSEGLISRSFAPQEQESVAWQLNLTSSCPAGDKTQCLGGYGFSLLANGKYQVGPGPEGQRVEGTLSKAELTKLDAAVHGASSALAASDVAKCETQDAAENSDRLVLESHGVKNEVFRSSGTTYCYHTTQQKAATQLYQVATELEQKYYPRPFPDACTDAVEATQNLYAPLRKCQADADCAYLDNTYFPIPGGEIQFVVTDDCSKLQSLSAANAQLARDHQGELLQARDQARLVCGDRFVRSQCEGVAGFQATVSPPLCVAGTCTPSPQALASASIESLPQ